MGSNLKLEPEKIMGWKKTFYENQAAGIIRKLESRKMKGYYCPDTESACRKVLELIGEPSKTVGYGGSMTIDGMGIKEQIVSAGHNLIIREDYTTPEQTRECKAKLINADVFLMSTNAVTLDGELVNIDGRGNRVAFLVYGPDKVIVLAGMNKVCATLEEARNRVRNIAAPPNTVRLGCDTPCAKTGRCMDCLPNSICASIVETRVSMIPERIQVVLIGEELGF